TWKWRWNRTRDSSRCPTGRGCQRRRNPGTRIRSCVHSRKKGNSGSSERLHKLFNSLLNGIAMATSKAHPLQGPSSPSAWICRFLPSLPPGAPVLDLACGGGRHLRLLHALGHRVTGIDRDLSGVKDLDGQPGVELLERDLEDGTPFPLADRQF